MKRYIAAGLVVFIGCAAAFAPAGLISRNVNALNTDVALLDPRGTVWNGQANVIAGGNPIGQIAWQLSPWSLLLLNPSADWQLNGPSVELNGDVSGFSQVQTRTNGELDLGLFSPLFNRYDMAIPGTITLHGVEIGIDVNSQFVNAADGYIEWSGGQVRYILSGILSESFLPKMRANLSVAEQKPTAEVFAEGEPIRLMQAQVADNGFVKIGITKMFTKLLNRPWPGSDPDHAVVLEVEEQLL